MQKCKAGLLTPPLNPCEIHVWRAEFETAPIIARAMSWILSVNERKGIAQYVRPSDRETRTTHWITLRLLLASYLGIQPQDIVIARAANGKPYLSGQSRIRFNMSLSGTGAVFAFSNGVEVGVDIERVRCLLDHREIANRFFSLSEIKRLQNLDQSRRERQFFRYWVGKESLLKATGEGLLTPLDHFVLGAASDGKMTISAVGGSDEEALNWWLEDFAVGDDAVGAVAANGVPDVVRYLTWDNRYFELLAEVGVCLAS